MTLILLEHWKVVLDIAGILSWAFLLGYIVKCKYVVRKSSLKVGRDNSCRSFNEEMYAQLVKRQVDQSFKKIFYTLVREKKMLCSFFEDGAEKNVKKSLSTDDIMKINQRHIRKNKQKTNSEPDGRKKYEKVIRLVSQGMAVNKISEEVKIPRGEVELIINLVKHRKKSNELKSPKVRAIS